MLNTIFSVTTLYFFIISLINVILSSTKSICTVRYGRGINVIANVIAYSFYTVVVKQTATLPLEVTILATAIANALGVWCSYAVLDRLQKDRLWKIECTVAEQLTDTIEGLLAANTISYKKSDCIDYGVGHCTVFSIYTKTREQSKKVKELLKNYKVKYFIVESQIL